MKQPDFEAHAKFAGAPPDVIATLTNKLMLANPSRTTDIETLGDALRRNAKLMGLNVPLEHPITLLPRRLDLITCTAIYDPRSQKLISDTGDSVTLTNTENPLVGILAAYAPRVVTKDEIFDNVWGLNWYGDRNTLAVYIRRLRMMIEELGGDRRALENIRGLGYRLTLPAPTIELPDSFERS